MNWRQRRGDGNHVGGSSLAAVVSSAYLKRLCVSDERNTRVHSIRYTQVYTGIHRYTQVYTGIHKYAPLERPTLDFIEAVGAVGLPLPDINVLVHGPGHGVDIWMIH